MNTEDKMIVEEKNMVTTEGLKIRAPSLKELYSYLFPGLVEYLLNIREFNLKNHIFPMQELELVHHICQYYLEQQRQNIDVAHYVEESKIFTAPPFWFPEYDLFGLCHLFHFIKMEGKWCLTRGMIVDIILTLKKIRMPIFNDWFMAYINFFEMSHNKIIFTR